MNPTTPFLFSDPALALVASGWWLFLLVIVAGVLSAVVYRFTLPPAPKIRRILLAVLRGTALALILFMLFEPVLHYLRSKSERPTVALLVDRSLSMTLGETGTTREALAKGVIRDVIVRELGDRAVVRAFGFADSLQEISLNTLDAMSFTMTGSNLSDAFDRVQSALSETPPVALILVSDGAYNLGENPARTAGNSASPILTVGVGDTTAFADAAIAEILTNEVTYKGSKVPIDVRVQARGLAGKSTILRLREPGGREFNSAEIHFDGDEFDRSISLEYTAGLAGDIRLTASIDSVRGEAISNNNMRSVIVRVLENRSRVILLSGPPTADLSALRQTLESDSSLDLRPFVELAPGKYYSQIPNPREEDFRSADLFVLVNYPTTSTADGELNLLLSALHTDRKPVLFLAGPDLSASRLHLLEEAIPVALKKSSLSGERVTLRSAAGHPALVGREMLPVEWPDLPPAIGGVGNFAVGSSAQVVCKLSREALGVLEDEPALAIWNSGGNRGAAFLCWNTSRWRLQLARAATGASFHSSLFSRLSSWLIAPAETRRVVIKTDRKLYSGGEKVSFQAQVYGPDLTPRDGASLELKVKSADRVEVVPLRARGNGRYDGQFAPWGNGDYEYSGVAFSDADSLGADRGVFAVEAFNVELLETQARFDVLRQIAGASQGSFAPVDRAADVLQSLELSPRVVSSKKELPLWNQATMLWIIISLLAGEWIIRKRSGML